MRKHNAEVRPRIPDPKFNDVLVSQFINSLMLSGQKSVAQRIMYDALDLIEELGFDQVNTAAYSPRPNTPAADWPDQLSEDVKVERLREINALVEKKAKDLVARARKGEKFNELARDNSDAESAKNEGELPPSKKGELRKELEEKEGKSGARSNT